MGRDSRLNPFNTTQSREPRIRDAYDRILAEGDLLLLQNVVMSPWTITKIAPAVDPNLPPGHLLVEVKQRLRFICPRDVAQREFVRVLTKEEAKPFEQVPQEPEPPVTNVKDFPITDPDSGPPLAGEPA